MPTLRITGLADVKLKQLIWPTLSCVLVIWFLTDTLSLSTPRNSSIDSTAVGTETNGRWSLSNQLHIYYGSQTHSGDDLRMVDNSAMSLSFVTANISTTTKAAVIIETRRSGQVIPLILHFAAVLGPDWPIVIYTSPENFGSFSTSHSLLRLQKAGRIVVRALAKGVYFPNWDSVSGFLTSKWMWEDLAPVEHILIFQSDSVLCANSVRSVEDFFEWDLIGAPIMPNFGIGYNGGLSLRKRSSILRILDEVRNILSLTSLFLRGYSAKDMFQKLYLAYSRRRLSSHTFKIFAPDSLIDISTNIVKSGIGKNRQACVLKISGFISGE